MLPLEGVRVIEFCNVAAGPFSGMLLADMGADVIKVEHPQGGDTMRAWPPITEGYSENFASLNRNKRSVTLDLKRAPDREQARQLVLGADVLIENNRPGVMQRLGLGYDDLKRAKPSLIYCSVSAFGQEGPRSEEGGFDLTMQAMSGIMSVTGEPGGAPVKCGVPLSDFCAGLYAAYAIAAVLRRVKEGGPGEHIDVSMLGTSIAIAALQTSEYFGTGRDPQKLGSAHPRNAPYQAFQAKDGYYAMAAGNDGLWKSACEAMGRTDLVGDPRFASTMLRAKNQAALKEIVEQASAPFTAVEMIGKFRAAGVPCAPINTYSSVLEDEQVRHMQWVQEIALPSGKKTRTFGSPLRFTGKGFPIRRDPPALGQHNDEVLAAREAGMTAP
jgi:crotonobetainyl-CoA:carnitine CoA-transferase CaiB-like acyl-CoA transferase